MNKNTEILIPIKLLEQALAETGSTHTDHGSWGIEMVRCSECSAYADEDGWGSVVEHKNGCRYALKITALRDLRSLLAKESPQP